MFKFLGKKIQELFKGKIDEESIEKLEEIFYQADLGTELSAELTEQIRILYQKDSIRSVPEMLTAVKRNLVSQLSSIPTPLYPQGFPHVILIVGVNGNGKTTTIAKLASYYQRAGKKVLIAAADTFRAAATEQLERWAQQIGAPLVKGKMGSDPAAIVFDAIAAAKSRSIDIVLIDTAGRLHTKVDLMKELEKLRRVSGKALPGSPHDTWLVLDATTGQNGVEQAQIFHRFTPLTGLILTKLDGSAKGGTAISIQKKVAIPIQFLGTGESVEDLEPFQAESFVESLFA